MMKFLKDEKGQGLSEYALIIGLVAVVAIIGLTFLGPTISDKFEEISCNLDGGDMVDVQDPNNPSETISECDK